MADNNKTHNIRLNSWIQFIIAIVFILLIASLSSVLRLRIDLTEDNRYTLSDPTKEILSSLENDIYIQVYLDGEIPVPLKRLRRSVIEMLEEFRIASGRKIDFEFINPSEGRDAEQRQKQYKSLTDKGLVPVDIRARDAEGSSTVKRIFPGMIVNYNGIEVPVNFLRNNPAVSYEQNILHSVEGLEYEMIQTISTLSSDTIYRVAFIEGHDEISEIETADITMNMARFFTVDRGVINGKSGVLDSYAAVIIAGPEKEFSEADKLVLDQYIMKGGRVMWLFDEVAVDPDSLVNGQTVGLYRSLNIEDQLFRYGARVNPAIIQDLECAQIRLKVMSEGARQQIVPAPWFYYPLLVPSAHHPVARSLNRVKGEFVNYIDTVGLDGAVRKTILLSTSSFSRTLSPPILISLKEAELTPDIREFNKPELPVAVLLEGVFQSAFKNRVTSGLTDDKSLEIKDKSVDTKLIVIADADIIRNEVSRSGLEEIPFTLGLDKLTGQVYGNRDFLINCLNYLVDDNDILELRSRELKLRLLNQGKLREERLKWQLINIAGPIILVIIAGLIYNYFRRRIYTT